MTDMSPFSHLHPDSHAVPASPFDGSCHSHQFLIKSPHGNEEAARTRDPGRRRQAAGVSVATVDRALNARTAVSDKRMALVYEAARALNYHGVPALRSRMPVKRPVVRIGVALRRRHNAFYVALEAAIRLAATRCADADVDIKVAWQSNNSPAEAASLIQSLARSSHTVALMAPDHRLVSDAVMAARERNVLTFSLLSDFAIDARQAYLGLDNRKAGRTAAWGLAHTAPRSGALSYRGRQLQLPRAGNARGRVPQLHPRASAGLQHRRHRGDGRIGRRCAPRRRTAARPGIATWSGSTSPAAASRAPWKRCGARAGSARSPLICNELIPASREALIDRAATMVIATPVEELARQLDRRSRSRRRCKRRRALQARAHPFRPVCLRERLKPRG